ncbi:MAG: cbb3-type cytochrome oxidase assembly protein CcoS [Gammaproteobacteria bacterium]|nr:cbb3-type cytochrome oxidase assembly protein CcoS [Gammaproteobacteria bacterium]
METFLILIPVTLALVALSLWAFVWSARNGQFEDIDRQAWSILFDNTEEEQKQELQKERHEEARQDIEAGAPLDEAERDGGMH